jgi:ammonia channel protein AmtB
MLAQFRRMLTSVALVLMMTIPFGYDDALDCFGMHAVGGIVGALLTGVFAIEHYGGSPGLIEGDAMQVVNQGVGVVIVLVYEATVSFIILKIIDLVRARKRRNRAARRIHAMTLRKVWGAYGSSSAAGLATVRGACARPRQSQIYYPGLLCD